MQLGLGPKEEHIAQKILRDSLVTRGNNKLNPYKNRARRWGWPVIVLPAYDPPRGWKKCRVRIVGGEGNKTLLPEERGFGLYIEYEDWLSALDTSREAEESISQPFGRFKVGIPYEEASPERDCHLIAKTLAYQAHRILGRSATKIREIAPNCAKIVESYEILQEPLCPLCHRVMEPESFITRADDTRDVFFKRREGEDKAIQLFHIEPLVPGAFAHRPGNVTWGHRRCNVTVGKHSVKETIDWFIEVLQTRGYDLSG